MRTQVKKRTEKDRAPRKFRGKAVASSKGQIIVYTGDGKGKTTAALGIVFRALGRKYRVGVVQFIKGAWKTGEGEFAKQLGRRLDFHSMGEGFTWDTQDFKRDVVVAKRAWAKCLELMMDERYRIVIFDELNYVLKYRFLKTADVVKALKKKPYKTHVIITGRSAPRQLTQIADLVTEMKLIKHPYQKGLKAQPGIDF
jgi:cob(I)alamin adenosyltransferase